MSFSKTRGKPAILAVVSVPPNTKKHERVITPRDEFDIFRVPTRRLRDRDQNERVCGRTRKLYSFTHNPKPMVSSRENGFAIRLERATMCRQRRFEAQERTAKLRGVWSDIPAREAVNVAYQRRAAATTTVTGSQAPATLSDDRQWRFSCRLSMQISPLRMCPPASTNTVLIARRTTRTQRVATNRIANARSVRGKLQSPRYLLQIDPRRLRAIRPRTTARGVRRDIAGLYDGLGFDAFRGARSGLVRKIGYRPLMKSKLFGLVGDVGFEPTTR